MLVIVEDDSNVDMFLSCRNLPRVYFNTLDALSVVDVCNVDKVLVEENCIAAFNQRYGAAEAPEAAEPAGAEEEAPADEAGEEEEEAGGEDEA